MLEQLAEYGNQIFSFNTLGILMALVALEASLSADNAIALATLVQDMEDPEHQRRALNWGLVVALILRIGLLLGATWVIQFWQFALAGALYLLWMAGNHFWKRFDANEEENQLNDTLLQPANSLWQVIPLIALTDLAFSLDSVTAAVSISDETWLIITGVFLGIIILRFLTGLFVEWLTKFPYLQDAAYLAILSVGLRMLFKLFYPDYVPPEWIIVTLMGALFTWGFSKRTLPEID
jgi:YkoY family integral membrane protein